MATQAGNKLIVSVKDQGIGISEEDQKHLFTSFFRGKNVDQYPGYRAGITYRKTLCRPDPGQYTIEK